ncbi:MAG: efflux RND transporter periplasmic adaptor subunit, partial [Terriglobia bacterium]
TVRARGIVKPAPNALVRVGFPMPKDVSRRINRLTVVEGNRVTVGAILAELDHDDLKASLAQLRADAAVAEREVEGLRALEPHDVAVAEAALAEARAQLELAQRNMERLASLFRQAIASQQAYDGAANDLAVAQAQHRHAETRLENTRAKYRADIATAEARLALARASLENIEVQIRWSVLRSPIDGQVFAVHQRQGELTGNQPQSPVVTLLDPQGLQLHLYVDETDSGRIEPGRKVSFRLDAHADKTLAGTIVRILPQPILQENVVYYLAVVDVEPEQRSFLRPEMTALAYIELGAREGVLRVPITAVKSRSDGWYVSRLDSGGAVETRVEVGWKDETGVEIRGGIAEGDVILLNP